MDDLIVGEGKDKIFVKRVNQGKSQRVMVSGPVAVAAVGTRFSGATVNAN